MNDRRLKLRGKKRTAVVWGQSEDGDPQQYRLSYDIRKYTAREAGRAFTADLAKIDSRTFVAPKPLTVREYVTNWLAGRRYDLAGKTWERYDSIIRNHIGPKLGKHRLQDLRPSHLSRAYVEWRDQGLSSQTVLHHRRLLHCILEQAVAENLVASNAAHRSQKLKADPLEKRALTCEELERLAAVAANGPFAPLIDFAVATGARRGELLGLKWDDIDFTRGTIAIRRSLEQTSKGVREKPPKNGKPRVVIPGAEALDALCRYRARCGRIDAYVFPDPVAGGMWTPHRITAGFRNLCRKAHISGVTFHLLRHTSASLLEDANVHPLVVKERLGHSSVNMTMKYSHTTPAQHADAAERLGEALRGPMAQLRNVG